MKVGTANPAAAGLMDANLGPAVVRAGRREAAEPHTKTRSHEAKCRSRGEHRQPYLECQRDLLDPARHECRDQHVQHPRGGKAANVAKEVVVTTSRR